MGVKDQAAPEPVIASGEEQLHRLQAPPGTDEANFGTERFPVVDGTVDVPAEAVTGLVGQGGFEEVTAAVAPAPEGFGRVRHHDPEASCSRGERQPDGSFLVPIGDVNELVSHGFTPIE